MLSLTGKRWVLEHNTPQPDIVDFLFQKRQLSDVPRAPPEFPDGKKALDRIEHAIESNEHIAIFGDYDCDGITATAQLVRFFRKRGVEPFVRLPHREHDGYGLKDHTVDEFIEKKVRLLITVDTGISSMPHIERLQQHGIDVIVMDHHTLPETLPNAFAILHPEIGHTDTLSAAGIVHTFLHTSDQIDTALACIGTVADVVELKGFNRHLVQKGLRALADICRGPLCELKKNAGLDTIVSARDIGFRIAPRINAAGRMDDPMIALTALLEGGEALRVLEKLNMERQADTRVFLKDAYERTEGHLTPFLCIASPLYPPGIIGLLAGKLSERYGRPALVGSVQGSQCTASLRSPPSFNVLKALRSCSHLLSRFGGHSRAAGCTFLVKNIGMLQEALSTTVLESIPESDLIPVITIDLPILPTQITLNLCKHLHDLEPLGEGNPEPRFLLQNASLEFSRQVGSDRSHLQAKIEDCKCIGFGLGCFMEQTQNPLDIICRLGVDEWQGRRQPKIVIDDIRLSIKNPSERVGLRYTGASLPSM